LQIQNLKVLERREGRKLRFRNTRLTEFQFPQVGAVLRHRRERDDGFADIETRQRRKVAELPFVIDHRIFAVPVLNFIFRTMRAIPIAPASPAINPVANRYDMSDIGSSIAGVIVYDMDTFCA
jgi:hypothetical protein